MTEDELLEHIDLWERSRPRLAKSGRPLWALIGHYKKVAHGDAADTADAYDISLGEMEVALEYYRRHPEVIDAFITLNEAASS